MRRLDLIQGLLEFKFFSLNTSFDQRGHDHEEEGEGHGAVQSVSGGGDTKDDHGKLHGGSQGFYLLQSFDHYG